MDQCNEQLNDKCPSANDYHDDGDEIKDEEDDDDNEDEVNHEPETIKSRRSSKWKPVWPGFNCVDCFGCCYFFYILFGCDKNDDQVSSLADETIKSTSSLFNYDVINQRPRRPTQMNIPLESQVIKKDSIVSTVTINDNNDQL